MKRIFYELLTDVLMIIGLMAYFPCLILFMRDRETPYLARAVFLNTTILLFLLISGLVQLGLDQLALILK